MTTAAVIHWRTSEAGPLVENCRKAGLDTTLLEGDGRTVCRAVRDSIPDVVVIDLTRLPSHGREVGGWLRRSKATRGIPIVYSGGLPDKVENVRKELPDALYCDLAKTGATAKRAAKTRSKAAPVVPPPIIERYRERTSAQKLGIDAGGPVCVVDSPRNFPNMLGVLPDGVDFTEEPAPLTLWFVETYDGLLASLRGMRAAAANTKLWVIWRKGVGREFNQNTVRESLIEVGLVDYKICSVSAEWSGMLFSRKKP